MPARLVGFYAADSVGKLTHAGTSLHAHALFDFHGVKTTAHVDRVAVAAGVGVYLPAKNQATVADCGGPRTDHDTR